MAEETVFICYRRDDSGETAGRIFDRLRTDLPAGTVFRDLDSIPLGVDFREHVRAKLAVARVVLVLIGPDWLRISDAQNRRRLDNPADHVRVEVELALGAENVRVIPILCRHAEMPGAQDLPESIGRLAFQNGQNVRPDPDFHRDVDHLRDSIRKILADVPKRPAVPVPAPKPADEKPSPIPAPAPPKQPVKWKEVAQNIAIIALFLGFWAGVICAVWTGGRYAIGKVTDYFHKPTPEPQFPFGRKPATAPEINLDWKKLQPIDLKSLGIPTPTPTPATGATLDGKPFSSINRKGSTTDLLFPNLTKTPVPSPTPSSIQSFDERIKKILDGKQPAPPASGGQ